MPLSKIGTQEFLEKLLIAVSTREGFGDHLAEGMASVAASDQVPAGARALIAEGVAPIGRFGLQPPRLNIVPEPETPKSLGLDEVA